MRGGNACFPCCFCARVSLCECFDSAWGCLLWVSQWEKWFNANMERMRISAPVIMTAARV